MLLIPVFLMGILAWETKYGNKLIYYLFVLIINSQFKILEQVVDERNKVKYLFCNIKGIKQLIPCKPSGIILNIPITNIMDLSNKYINKDIYIIGGPKVLTQLFELIEEFYLTRIYGNFNCDKSIDLQKIQESMKMIKKIENDKTCHFEIWKR